MEPNLIYLIVTLSKAQFLVDVNYNIIAKSYQLTIITNIVGKDNKASHIFKADSFLCRSPVALTMLGLVMLGLISLHQCSGQYQWGTGGGAGGGGAGGSKPKDIKTQFQWGGGGGGLQTKDGDGKT